METTGELLRRLAGPAFFVSVLFIALWLRGPRPAPGPLDLHGPTMGTTYSVKVLGGDVQAAAVQEAVDRTLAEIDALMSTWRDDSELSRFNRAGTEPFPLSPPTLEVLRLADSVHQATGGAFDPTVGPLIRAWGFGPEGERAGPDEGELAEILGYVGWGRLRLEAGAAIKGDPRLEVDLSAIAKGYGVDRVAEAVAAVPGVTGAMVEIGGEVRVLGQPPAERPWRLGIERPDAQRRALHSVIELTEGGLATSGDYRRFIEDEGGRRTHVVDPRTGRSVQRGVASASVLAPDCATADAWATSLMVLPPDDGLARVRARDGLEAMLIVRTADGLDVRTTPGFERALAADAAAGR